MYIRKALPWLLVVVGGDKWCVYLCGVLTVAAVARAERGGVEG